MQRPQYCESAAPNVCMYIVQWWESKFKKSCWCWRKFFSNDKWIPGSELIIHGTTASYGWGINILKWKLMYYILLVSHRRRMKTCRRKGKGCRFCLGRRIYSIPCHAKAVLPRTILNNRMNSSLFQIIPVHFILLFKTVLGKTAFAWQGLE